MSVFRHEEHMKKGHIWAIRSIFIVVIAMIITIGATAVWYKANIVAVDSSDKTLQEITIRAGDSETTVSKLLESKGLIKSAFAYQLYTRFNDARGETKAGVYELSPTMSVSDIVRKLVEGDVKVDLLTILPAQRLSDIKDAFIEKGYTLQEVEEALSPELYSSHPALVDKPKLANLEGYLYPESFQFTSTTPLRAIVGASLDQTAELFTPEIVQKLKDRGLSVHDAVILASIVEKEVSKSEDKPTVAQVFLTRLERGIPLGADPTANYGAFLAGIEEPAVLADTNYNTRLYTGLPPGPISNITASSLLAIVNPSETDYLFFVAGDDGVTYFSRTLAEHEALTAKYCTLLC